MGQADSFLARWLRRKRFSAARELADPAIPATAVGIPLAPPERAAADAAPQQLPPIESLDAGSDITPFLASGVPAELTRQALRRAWTADPAIRDFIGLSENAWDFTAADGVPGFGSLSAEDARRLLVQALGPAGSAEPPQPERKAAAPGGEVVAEGPAGELDCHRAKQISGEVGRPQDFDEAELNRPPPPHSHGGVRPK
jgi:hypothetical protein